MLHHIHNWKKKSVIRVTAVKTVVLVFFLNSRTGEIKHEYWHPRKSYLGMNIQNIMDGQDQLQSAAQY